MCCEMTAFRLIPFGVHGALELPLGLAAMALPFVLGLSAAATVIAVVVGAAIVGLALASTTDERGRPALPVATHFAADYGVALGLAGAALLVAVADDVTAGVFLGAVAALQLILNLSTRYTARA